MFYWKQKVKHTINLNFCLRHTGIHSHFLDSWTTESLFHSKSRKYYWWIMLVLLATCIFIFVSYFAAVSNWKCILYCNCLDLYSNIPLLNYYFLYKMQTVMVLMLSKDLSKEFAEAFFFFCFVLSFKTHSIGASNFCF